jgi:hypothetical protein
LVDSVAAKTTLTRKDSHILGKAAQAVTALAAAAKPGVSQAAKAT